MKKQLIQYTLLMLIFAYPATVTAQVGTWESLPALTEVRDLEVYGSDVLLASDGGVMRFSMDQQVFEYGISGSQSRNLDVNTLVSTPGGLLWVGSRSPGPIVEVIELSSGQHLGVEFVDLDEVTSFAQVGDSVYASFKDGIDGGLLLYRIGVSKVEYLDLFSNFPPHNTLDLSTANDVLIIDDKIIFRTRNQLLWAEQAGTNLKDPNNWNLVAIPTGNSETIRMIPQDAGVLLAADNNIYSYNFDSFTLKHTASAAIVDLKLTETALVYASIWGIYTLDLNAGTAELLESLPGIKSIAVDGDGIWLANTFDFLGNWTEQNYTPYSANRPRDHLFNRMIVESNGELAATASNGISILSGQGWRTIHGGAQNSDFEVTSYNWDRMISEVLDYGGHAVVEDMIEDHSGNLFLALQGKGILKLDPSAPQEYSFFNAINGFMEPTFDSQTHVLPTQMAVDSENYVWTTTKLVKDGGHAITIISENEEAYHINQHDGGLSTTSAKSIAIDDHDMVWLGSQVRSELQAAGGIHLIKKNGSFEGDWDIEVSALIDLPLASNEILQLEIDNKNTLWILTPSGVQSMPLPDDFKTTTELKAWANLHMTEKVSDSYYYWQLTDYNVTGIEIDPRGNVWFLSSNAGVHVLQENGRWINGGFGYNSGNSGLLDNEIYSIAFDGSTGETYISTAKGISILNTPFANSKDNYSNIHIYPQPFNPDIHERVIIQGLMDNSTVKILTVSGEMVKELNAENSDVQGFEAQWDGKDRSGDIVGSGVYILYLFNEDGGASSQKLAILR